MEKGVFFNGMKDMVTMNLIESAIFNVLENLYLKRFLSFTVKQKFIYNYKILLQIKYFSFYIILKKFNINKKLDNLEYIALK